MKFLHKLISSNLFSKKFWSLGCGLTIFMLIVLFVIAYGPWIPRTKTLASLKDLPLKLPANFAEFPSEGACTWAILSYGSWDVLWGKHTGLQDVAEWRINFYLSQGLQPQFSTDPQYAIHGVIRKEDEMTMDEYYTEMNERLENSYVTIDLGTFNAQLKGIKGIDIARFVAHERKFIMCWVNDEIFVFAFHVY